MSNPFLGNLSNCWRFNDSLAGINGQPFLIPSPAFEPAKFGNGLRMNGAVESVGPAIGSAAATGPYSWTGICWFKPDSFNFGSFVLNSNNGFFGGFELTNMGDGTLLFSTRILNAGSVGVSNPTVMNLGDFNLLCFGYNSITQKSFLRVNNVHVDYPGTFTIPVGIAANLTVGNRPTLKSTPASGIINLLAVWYGHLLDVTEMDLLWNGGAGLDYPFA